MLGMLSSRGAGFSPTNETSDDGVDNDIGAILRYPREKIMKTIVSNNKLAHVNFIGPNNGRQLYLLKVQHVITLGD